VYNYKGLAAFLYCKGATCTHTRHTSTDVTHDHEIAREGRPEEMNGALIGRHHSTSPGQGLLSFEERFEGLHEHPDSIVLLVHSLFVRSNLHDQRAHENRDR
jgi:hypothetical protein